MSSATVVGSGPNGLACAVALARAGVRVTVLEAGAEIGGGVRSAELTLPGLVHDVCSAVHPMAVASPFLGSLPLAEHGLRWCQPPLALAHPLPGGRAAALHRSISSTAAGLGPDGPSWSRRFGGISRTFPALNAEISRPFPHLPRHPLGLARFGLLALSPATLLARGWRGEEARALFGGVAAHAYGRLDRPLSAAVGVALVAAAHSVGWPVAAGGSQAISDALAALLGVHGGKIETGVRVRSLDELEGSDATVFDLAPGAVADIVGERLPAAHRRAYRRYRHGPGAFKLDLAVEGGVPWDNEDCRQAGTVHVIGSLGELAAAEREVGRGRLPERPFVLVGQQYLADPSRSRGDVHPVWAYAHVPSGWEGDGERLILDQIERFAPGLRERVLASASRSPAEIEAGNANYVGGDILTGANTPRQVLLRPRPALDPYSVGAPGLFICSAATPPGAGVHGMGGCNAARSVLRYLERT